MHIEFRSCDWRGTSRVLNCISFRFDTNKSNVANGVAPVLASFENMWVSSPFNILKRDSDDSIQYLSVDKDSFNKLKSMVKDPNSEPSKRQLMLATAQILLKNGYFIDKHKIPRTIYVYDSDEHYRYVRGFFPENLKYLKHLPKTVKIEDNYAVDAKTAGKLDKMANVLYKTRLNKAILNLFNYFSIYRYSYTCNNVFSSLYKALLKHQKAAKYKPTKEFLDKLHFISNECSKARVAVALKEIVHPEIVNNLKHMEFFLFLSQNFGYQIPQNLKTDFTSKISSLINTLKSVFSSYNHFKDGKDLKDKLFMLQTGYDSDKIMIDNIAKDICSMPMNKSSEYSDSSIFSDWVLPDLIAHKPTIIGYNNNKADAIVNYSTEEYNFYWDKHNDERIDYFCSRLRPLMQNSEKFALFASNVKKDPNFPLYEQENEGYNRHNYSLYDHYEITLENSLCYLNLAEFFNQVVDSPYPYEFTKQAVLVKLPEIMPFISTAFCDIPKIC